MNRHSRKAFLFVTLILTVSFTFGQKLVRSESNGTMTAAEINQRMTKMFGSYAVGETSNAVELYKVTYSSIDVKNKKTNLTGLVAWPVGGAPKGLVVYCHGTTVDRGRSPSKFKAKEDEPETEIAIAGFVSGGYAVVLPDYLGLGDHKGAHPYPLSSVNARSAVDMIPAARELAKQNNYVIGPKLYVTGYSEGGGVAMAVARDLQAMVGENYRLTASAPASGPYDLSGTTRKFMLEETGEQTGFVLRLYLMSYATNYLNKEKGSKLKDFYKPALANALGINYRLNPSDDGVIKNIGLTTTLMRSQNKLENVLNPTFMKAMQRNDGGNAFVRELRMNDVYAWQPRRPMLMIYVDKDFVVSPVNTEVAYKAMQRMGVKNDMIKTVEIPSTFNHLTGIAPAMAKARAFFDGGFSAVPDAR
ncbi:MAG: lipase family protein [Pyrinomonadaceae bacterium]